jgi:hypothetical protein
MTFTNANTLTTIDRSQGFEVTWSGGNPNSFVYISGDVTVKGGNSVGFICSENVAAGKFKVPAYITSALPSGAGGVVLQNIFWIPLNASGLDAGSVGGSISAPSVSVTFK